MKLGNWYASNSSDSKVNTSALEACNWPQGAVIELSHCFVHGWSTLPKTHEFDLI